MAWNILRLRLRVRRIGNSFVVPARIFTVTYDRYDDTHSDAKDSTELVPSYLVMHAPVPGTLVPVTRTYFLVPGTRTLVPVYTWYMYTYPRTRLYLYSYPCTLTCTSTFVLVPRNLCLVHSYLLPIPGNYYRTYHPGCIGTCACVFFYTRRRVEIDVFTILRFFCRFLQKQCSHMRSHHCTHSSARMQACKKMHFPASWIFFQKLVQMKRTSLHVFAHSVAVVSHILLVY